MRIIRINSAKSHLCLFEGPHLAHIGCNAGVSSREIDIDIASNHRPDSRSEIGNDATKVALRIFPSSCVLHVHGVVSKMLIPHGRRIATHLRLDNEAAQADLDCVEINLLTDLIGIKHTGEFQF
jgi:hypothetical protein